MNINVSNNYQIRLKVIATDGRVAERDISLKKFLETYLDDENIIEEVSTDICDCTELTESGYQYCGCAEAFWETDSENIYVELIEKKKPELIEDLDSTVRCYNFLKTNKIDTVEQLESLTLKQIENMELHYSNDNNSAKKWIIKEIVFMMNEFGITLKEELSEKENSENLG